MGDGRDPARKPDRAFRPSVRENTMRSVHVMTGLFLTTLVLPLAAQAPECGAYSGNAEKVCSAGVDGTRAFHPLFGMLVSGGNPTIGSAATLGGVGHASLTLRANASNVVLPDLNYTGSSSRVPAGDEVLVPAPMVEGALGIYKGMGGGLGAVDLLGSALLLPTEQLKKFSVDPDARRLGIIAIGLGYGARIGLMRGSGPLPNISVSAMRRDVPTITYGDVAGGDTYGYSVNLHATNLRLIASKQLAVLDLAG